MKATILAILAATALAGCTTTSGGTADAPAADYSAALADRSRPEADRARDAARKPEAILALAEVGPGDKVADFIMGGGYWTRILSGAVGPEGRVYAYQPAEFIQFRAAYAAEQDAAVAGRANVVPSRDSLTVAAFPEPLDAIITVQNWHDFHLNVAPAGSGATMARHLFSRLKPGGVLLVVDHSAKPGTGWAAADSLHRGDKAATRAEIEGAGFTFVEESDLYANPADPMTAIVFDPAIRGKTDQFILKFRKPA